MFKQLKRIAYQVQDLEMAKAWYSKILGYPPLFDAPFAVIFSVGNCSLSLTEATATNNYTDSYMEVYWEVDDIEMVISNLLQNGATLHTPITGMLNIRTAKVMDPFGNIIGITVQGTSDNRKTVESKPSQTALTVAFCRALGAKEDRLKLNGPDYLAEIFLNVEAKVLLGKKDTRSWAIQNLVTPPLYGYFFARTAYMDSIFTDFCSEGEDESQIVFLGAGYDTRTIRFCDYIKNIKIFELDIPTTQNRKIDCLHEAGITTPETLKYVPINFEKENILDVLLKAGYNPLMRTLFICEGVMYYLTKSAVESTLNFIAKHSGPESCICFDCLNEELQSVNAAEPFRFWLKPNQLSVLLSNLGLKTIEILDSEEMIKRYLSMSNEVQSEKSLTSFFFMLAKKD